MGRMKDLFGDIPVPETPLFPYGGKAPSQRHSPTSVAAAEAIEPKIGRLHRLVLQALAASRYGETDEDLMRLTGMGGNTLRPRRIELQLWGKVRDSGRTRPVKSGKNATLWEIVPPE
jgi:hypothetical protein